MNQMTNDLIHERIDKLEQKLVGLDERLTQWEKQCGECHDELSDTLDLAQATLNHVRGSRVVDPCELAKMEAKLNG